MTLADKKKKYNAAIATYQKRRRDTAANLKLNPLSRNPKDKVKRRIYRQRNQVIDKKIMTWQKAMRRIDTIRSRLYAIERAVVSFTGTKIRYKVEERGKEYRLARALFFTFGLENGCRGIDLSEYVGNHKKRAAKARLEFKATFKTISENRQLWLSFNEFFKEKYKLPQKCK